MYHKQTDTHAGTCSHKEHTCLQCDDVYVVVTTHAQKWCQKSLDVYIASRSVRLQPLDLFSFPVQTSTVCSVKYSFGGCMCMLSFHYYFLKCMCTTLQVYLTSAATPIQKPFDSYIL